MGQKRESAIRLLASSAVVLVILCLAFASISTADDQAATTATRPSFKLPKLLDFGQFKLLFKRHYSSLLEEAARRRIYLANAFKAFISGVSYKFRRSRFYLAINSMSDWTKAEFREISLNRGELEYVLNEHSSESGYKEIANELKESSQDGRKRMKRDVDDDDSLDRPDISLTNPSGMYENSDRFVVRISSDNPNHNKPKLTKAGISDRPVNGDEIQKTFPRASPVAYTLASAQISHDYLHGESSNTENHIPILRHSGETLLVPPPDGVKVDHRRSNCFFKPRDQGHCGACYAFAAISIYEWAHCMATGEKVAFSEQYILDCGHMIYPKLEGCRGGTPMGIDIFMHKAGLLAGH